MITDKKIQILMSTYNGQQYLRAQLDSFLVLEDFERIKVLIRDDGSTDATRMILQEYQKKYGFEVIEGENLGVNGSMFELFRYADLSSDYFALSDQDDVWLPHKFTLALAKLEGFDEKEPLLFASCSQITDELLFPIGGTLFPKEGVSFYNAMIQNVCPGHTQVFNRALLRELIEKSADQIHVIDYWIYLVASALGKVVFDEQFTVLHRQHNSNAVGYEVNYWKNSIKRIKRMRLHKTDPSAMQLKAFYYLYRKRLPEKYRREIERYFSSQKHIYSRIVYALTGKAYRQTLFETLIFKGLYIFGKYNV